MPWAAPTSPARTGSTSPWARPSAASAIVCGENVCGIDPGLELNAQGKVIKSPEMDRRVREYRRYHEGYGDILVQMNVEDTRLGVAEYVIDKLGVETIELEMGPGRQVHRRRDQGQLPRAARSNSRSAATS
ncbi:MAG: hypothetical protein MZV70_51545 [Desulfobacterales bacterium]|nr:hypothetical protein [Desulfobacterales bacterium]